MDKRMGTDQGTKHSPGFLKLVDDARKRVWELSVEEVAAKIERGEKFLLVDVREESEWREGHLPGAMHLSKGTIERDIEARISNAAAEIVLYCRGGYRSVLAAESLQKMGYLNVRSMTGGFKKWVAKGNRVDKKA
jgi:rhodanese-related sulfurtransferase